MHKYTRVVQLKHRGTQGLLRALELGLKLSLCLELGRMGLQTKNIVQQWLLSLLVGSFALKKL